MRPRPGRACRWGRGWGRPRSVGPARKQPATNLTRLAGPGCRRGGSWSRRWWRCAPRSRPCGACRSWSSIQPRPQVSCPTTSPAHGTPGRCGPGRRGRGVAADRRGDRSRRGGDVVECAAFLTRVGSARGGRDHEGGARVAPGGAVGLPAGPGDGGGASGAAGDRLLGRAGRRLAAGLDGAGGVRPGARAVDHRVARSRRRRRAADPGPGRARASAGMCGTARRGSPPPTGSCPMGSGRGSRGSCWTAPGSRSTAMRVGRGGWRSGTPRTTSTSPRCWCARTPVDGSGRTTTTRSSARRPGGSSSASG